MEHLDKTRWRLFCSLCKKKNVGACIQCADSHPRLKCLKAVHVTCAQKAQLFMSMTDEAGDLEIEVYCRRHSPRTLLPNFSVCPKLAATPHLLMQVT